MESTLTRATLTFAALLSATGVRPAYAAPASADAAKPGPCDADTRKFCADLPNGVPRCLSENAPSLSKECRRWVHRYDRAKKKAKLECRSALKAACPDAQGWDAMMACVSAHDAADAPRACIEIFQALMKARAVILNRAATPAAAHQ